MGPATRPGMSPLTDTGPDTGARLSTRVRQRTGAPGLLLRYHSPGRPPSSQRLPSQPQSHLPASAGAGRNRQYRATLGFLYSIPAPRTDGAPSVVTAWRRALRRGVVAEGVESAGQAQVLRDLGCDFLPGFRYRRPELPAAISHMRSGGW